MKTNQPSSIVFKGKSADLQIDGDFHWSGSLKKDEPIELSGTVVFNKEGDYGIEAWSKTPESTSLSGGNNQTIFLHIGKEASRYGWTESKELSLLPSPLPDCLPKTGRC